MYNDMYIFAYFILLHRIMRDYRLSAHLIIVRHCEAQGNTERVFQGRIDSDISPNGVLQAECLAERFKNCSYDHIYSGPLKRTMFTAEAVNRYHGLPIQTDARLVEIDGGDWGGKRWSDLPRLYPEQAKIWAEQPHLFEAPNGETMVQVRERIVSAACDIAMRHMDETVVIVSHGCAIRNLLCWAKGWSIERLIDVSWGDNSSVSQIDIDKNGIPSVIFEGDNSHLKDGLSTLGRQSWWKNNTSPFESGKS